VMVCVLLFVARYGCFSWLALDRGRKGCVLVASSGGGRRPRTLGVPVSSAAHQSAGPNRMLGSVRQPIGRCGRVSLAKP
jgi:hypothetical protein